VEFRWRHSPHAQAPSSLQQGHRHFFPDPQYLGHLTPRLNTVAESLTSHYIEQHGFTKLYFPEGEIDFIASGHFTPAPTVIEQLFGHDVAVETSTEIVAKKMRAWRLQLVGL
jgi:hypothetical protein